MKKYKYASDTEDESAYITPENERFNKWRKEKKKRHLLKLWRNAYNKATGANLIINLQLYLTTKIGYFGR